MSVAGKAGPKIYLYSGHDTTIMPLLITLGLEVRCGIGGHVHRDRRTPPLGATNNVFMFGDMLHAE